MAAGEPVKACCLMRSVPVLRGGGPGSDQRDVNVQHMSIELDKANGEKIRFDTRSEGYEYLHVSQGEIKSSVRSRAHQR